jgi:hypothetical protein
MTTEPRQLRWRAEPAVRRSGSSLILTGWLAVGEKMPNIDELVEVAGETWRVASWSFSGRQGQPGDITFELVRPAE